MKKIAFCFLIYDIINHEELWNFFFANVDTNKYNIYIHYKVNKPLEYFEKYKLTNCIETKYAHVTLIHAHNLLFKKAYEDGCDKMINLSQSCIPFKSFDYVYNFLTKDDFGHFNISPHPQCFPRCNRLTQYYDKSKIQKSSEWFILNRKICELIIHYDKTKINNEYTNIDCPEEHYFITNIFNNNLQDEIITTPNLTNDATTFINWEDMDYKYPSTSGLKNYSFITEDELSYLLNSKCLFGRKFNVDCASLYNKKYIESIFSNDCSNL
jgi:hypothetical protein